MKLRVHECGFPVYIGQGTKIHGKDITLGKDVNIMSNCLITVTKGYIEIGDRVSLNNNVNIWAELGDITIRNDVMIGVLRKII